MSGESLEKTVTGLIATASRVEGHITDREIRCLAVLAALPSANGVILEIGSFKGRSTIVLAKSAALAGETKIVAVDPLTSPAKTDPDLGGQASGWSDFQLNLKNAGVENAVEFHCQRSAELAGRWNPSRKIRLLWIDGDHTYAGAKSDLDLFRPYLADGAIVAMHDVLHSHEGPARVFAEDILLSPHFGPFGFCGSIAWAQYFEAPAISASFRSRKARTYRRLTRLIALSVFYEPLQGWHRLRYKLARAMIPHGDVSTEEFQRRVLSVR